MLAGADVLAAEDTRTLRHLMEIHGIALGGRPLIAYHDHNEAVALPRLLGVAEGGEIGGLCVRGGDAAGLGPRVRAGAGGGGRGAAGGGRTRGLCAVLCALACRGLPSDRFLFAGFPPAAAGERARFLAELAPVRATLILYESPRRAGRLLGELAAALGGERQAALCRELTKRFEEVARGDLAELAARFAEAEPKGEVVLVIDRAPERRPMPRAVEDALREALEDDER